MDIYYMSDSIQYGSFRNPMYRDYEKFPYGTLENPLNSPPKSSHQLHKQQQQKDSYNMVQGKTKSKSSKEACPFCKEQKKRPLGAYLRKRGKRITSESISEDVEECAEGVEEEQEEPIAAVSGSPSNNELLHNHHHQHHDKSHQVLKGGRYSRQDSQDNDVK